MIRDGSTRRIPMITMELFGVPRLRAGTRSVKLDAPTLRAALDGLGRALPVLDGTVLHDGRLHPAYRVCLNGDRFVSDPDTALADGDELLLLAADVGG